MNEWGMDEWGEAGGRFGSVDDFEFFVEVVAVGFADGEFFLAGAEVELGAVDLADGAEVDDVGASMLPSGGGMGARFSLREERSQSVLFVFRSG